ncbi:hypothetical protein HK096_004715, partial [Nowakowskiella sp. JEL0078]
PAHLKSVTTKRATENKVATVRSTSPKHFSNKIFRTFGSKNVKDFARAHNRTQMRKPESDILVKQLAQLTVEFGNTENTGTTLVVYDFAGQSHYSAFQQIFVTRQAIYLVAFHLDNMFKGGEDILEPTELQIVLTWLSTIHLRAPKSKILLVGTQANNAVRYNLGNLEARLPRAVLHQLIYSPSLDDLPSQFIFVTSAKTRLGIKELQQSIDEAVKTTVSMEGEKPVDWIRFQDKLAEMISENECPLIISFQDMLQLAKKEFRISNTMELEVVLQYLHTIGVILYFSQNKDLKNSIFLNPQSVVNIVASMFCWNDISPTEDQVKSHNRKAVQDLRDRKLWRRSLLDELWSTKLKPNELPIFVELLKEFDLLCDIKLPKVNDSNNLIEMEMNKAISIIPCLLTNEIIAIEKLVRDHDSEIIDLVLAFPDSVLPTG